MPQVSQSPSIRRFHDLIPFRVREVLLVSSPYDAFILQEDGHLTEKMFIEYRDISMASSPRFTHTTTSEEAIRLLKERRFDLILVMTSLMDMDADVFGRHVKALQPNQPVVLLALERNEASELERTVDREALEGVYVWAGDIQVLLAIIKTVEDKRNVDHDIEKGNVRVIILIEDSPQYYSSFLGFLYKELMRQSSSLYSEGKSDLYRKMYMKSRPKILHARSYEEAMGYFDRYKANVLAVITDIAVPRGGEIDPEAGLEFVRVARRHDPELPLLVQSADTENRQKALELGAAFIDKNGPGVLGDIGEFLSVRLGFGDFIFRKPSGEEVDRARDLSELEEKLATIPEEQLVYHASRNHISIWLMARSEFGLAADLRPKSIDDFASVEECRQYIINSLRENRRRAHRGVISDFHPDRFLRDPFTRIGAGYLGGKARGIAFLYQSIADLDSSEFGGLPTLIPQTIVLTTEGFDRFLDSNDLKNFAFSCKDDQLLGSRFLKAQLPDDLVSMLDAVVNAIQEPLAVRSSSLLEDSMHQPFAGVYSTLMIPNQDPDSTNRLRDLCNAVKLVYASTFSKEAKSYLKATGNRIEEEKMAVILQRVVGQQYGRRFYPNFSGVAQSHNYYPIGPQKSDDGVVHVALGLGRLIVDGGLALRFSPKHPQVIPQFAIPKSLVDCTQRGFWALDLDQDLGGAGSDLYTTLKYYGLEEAEEDGALHPIGSVYDSTDDRIRDDLVHAGPRVITFNNILKYGAIPLPEALNKILDMTRAGLGCAVEIEFACDLGDWGRRRRRGEAKRNPELHLLQVRPLGSRFALTKACKVNFDREETLCFSMGSLGHGVSKEIQDIIFVRQADWSPSKNKMIAKEVAGLNVRLEKEGRRYLLIGPGRWGTSDQWLGIPVKWSQISSAKVIVEASPEGYNVDPSQGTHFFHNITAQGIGYLALPPGADKRNAGSQSYLDWDWLNSQKALDQTSHLTHLRFDLPLTVFLDGRNGRGVIGKPGT